MIYKFTKTIERYKVCYLEAEDLEEAKSELKNAKWISEDDDEYTSPTLYYQCGEDEDEANDDNMHEIEYQL